METVAPKLKTDYVVRPPLAIISSVPLAGVLSSRESGMLNTRVIRKMASCALKSAVMLSGCAMQGLGP